MAPLAGSPGVMALATAMAAVSGTVIFIVVHRQKLLSNAQFSITTGQNSTSPSALRSCIYSDLHGKRKGKKEKRVRFAEDVAVAVAAEAEEDVRARARKKSDLRRRMPANQAALYRGIIQDRSHRMACSY